MIGLEKLCQDLTNYIAIKLWFIDLFFAYVSCPVFPTIREKFESEVKGPRFAKLKNWHHGLSAQILNVQE